MHQAMRKFSGRQCLKHSFGSLYPCVHLSSSVNNIPDICVDEFCMRQFQGEADYNGSNKINWKVDEFEAKINEMYEAQGRKLIDGYASFCKHLFVPNIFGIKSSTLRITDDNKHLLLSEYEARTEGELPVLMRWFHANDVPIAKYLDVILYSREQIILETKSMGGTFRPKVDSAWRIVSIKGQDVDYELPMQPITMMRNALGREMGGSGVPLETKKYQESVNFWSRHANVRLSSKR